MERGKREREREMEGEEGYDQRRIEEEMTNNGGRGRKRELSRE